jgi:prepilin-type N-terminal cleavage/methylation domain-containing protein
MAKRRLLSRFQRFWYSSRRAPAKGFTLLELLVVTAIAGGIVSGLMFIVVQLMTSDQRESSKSETQREMQLALDYISTEMRDAVYVYTGARLDAITERNNRRLLDFLPASLSTNSVPVVAFWKMQPFPSNIRTACAGTTPPAGAACSNGASYALVVYSLSTANSGNTWKGKARITRYALTQFNTTSTVQNAGYVNPGTNSNNFDTWPLVATTTGATTTFTNPQTSLPTDSPAVLVDFVDNSDSTMLPNNAGQVGVCPPDNPDTTYVDYNISPSTAALTAAGMAGVRSFYACVSTRELPAVAGQPVRQDLGDTQDTLLYLRGNVFGRPGGFGATSFLPTLETRVLSRGVLGRVPND